MSLLPPLEAIQTLLDQGAADSAVRLLRSSWEPELPPEQKIYMYCMWIRGLCETRELDHAVTLAKRAAQEFPQDCDVLLALGNVLDLTGDLQGARKAFELVLSLQPHTYLAYFNLGSVLERLHQDKAAEACYLKAWQLDSDAAVDASLALGALMRRQGRLEEAQQIYATFLETNPPHIGILVEHGICLADLNQLYEAIKRFNFALSLDANHGGALYNKAIVLHRLGKVERAIETLEQAYHCDPNNPLTLAVLGSWYLALTPPNLDQGLHYLYRSLAILEQAHSSRECSASYGGLVMEEVFEALWSHGRQQEAREVARMAGRLEWITPHILNQLNEADYGHSSQASTYKVLARAETGERPDYWPENSNGYTTGFTVVARNEDEARQFALQYLRAIDPSPTIRFHLDIVPPQTANEQVSKVIELASMEPRAQGVAQIDRARSYNYSS